MEYSINYYDSENNNRAVLGSLYREGKIYFFQALGGTPKRLHNSTVSGVLETLRGYFGHSIRLKAITK